MNCLEFRRRLTTEPTRLEEDVLRHQRECKACAVFGRHQALFDQRLADAMKLDVPEGLVSRLLLRQSLSTVWWQRTRLRRWSAVAASVFLVIGLASGLWFTTVPPPLARAVLTHIYGESEHLRERHDVQLAQLNRVLRGLGAELRHDIGRVNYAGSCLIGKYYGAHLVLQGNQGPVTVLIMPGESLGRRLSLQDRRFQGVIVSHTNGSLAIVGERGEEIDRIEARLHASLRAVF